MTKLEKLLRGDEAVIIFGGIKSPIVSVVYAAEQAPDDNLNILIGFVSDATLQHKYASLDDDVWNDIIVYEAPEVKESKNRQIEDGLEAGDIIEGNELEDLNRKVLAAVGEVVAVSQVNDHSRIAHWDSLSTLIEEGWRLKSSEKNNFKGGSEGFE